MKNIKCTKDPEPTFLNDSSKSETEEGLSYPLDLPLFYTTSDQREVMKDLMVETSNMKK